MRRQHRRLCKWFRPNLASPRTATSDVNIIAFVCGLVQTGQTGNSYMKSQHHRLCMWLSPNLISLGAATSEVNIIVFVCGLDQTSLHQELLHEKTTSSSLYLV